MSDGKVIELRYTSKGKIVGGSMAENWVTIRVNIDPKGITLGDEVEVIFKDAKQEVQP